MALALDVPINYICIACKTYGKHWIINCPSLDQKRSSNSNDNQFTFDNIDGTNDTKDNVTSFNVDATSLSNYSFLGTRDNDHPFLFKSPEELKFEDTYFPNQVKVNKANTWFVTKTFNFI